MFGQTKAKLKTIFDALASHKGQLKALQSNIDKTKERVEQIERRINTGVKNTNLSSEKYVECSICGSLVSKEKAKVEWEMREKSKGDKEYKFRLMNALLSGNQEYEEKEAVKTFKCLHCQKGKRK